MNYHFVGDVIAGAMLGSITGVCMTHVFRLQRPKPESAGNQ
jgi:membrane-associated phospholipid phosphatase